MVTYSSTALGLSAFSANGRIQPHGAPAEYYFEYGTTTAYGSKSPVKRLGPRLAAFYGESWDDGLDGFESGPGVGLSPAKEGADGFVRYEEPTVHDYNHVDGIGIIHLAQYFYIGSLCCTYLNARLGGARADLRDARVRVRVRGNAWKPAGTELAWWLQTSLKPAVPDADDVVRANWAHTGFLLTDAILTGKWEAVEYRLYSDSTDWTYAGANASQGRNVYAYFPIDDVLRDADVDAFHNLLYVSEVDDPLGSIDFDDLEISYRNHSMLLASNGGKLESAPPGSENPAALTDGWRHGAGKMWKSAPSPQAPQEIIYSFEREVTIERVQLHQHLDYPSKDIQVLASIDGTSWTLIHADTMAERSSAGPNFAYTFGGDDSVALMQSDVPARFVKVRILSGYKPDYWGLGEIEIFGTGAVERTDDDWYRVSEDIKGLAPGQTYHYRLVAVVEGMAPELGGDNTFTVPADAKPIVTTGAATRIAGGSARVAARINSLGLEAQHYFEYGPTTSYGARTDDVRTGIEITPRTIMADLRGLTPGTVHFRAVTVSAAGTTYGGDVTFVAK